MDICGDVESLGELRHNLEFVERTVAPKIKATCLIMPSQAYVRHVILQRPDASREELMATFKAGADTFVRNTIHGNLGGEAEE